jgi:chlorite dismutase
VTHSFYALDRGRLAGMSAAEVAAGADAFAAALDPAGPHAPRRLQTWVVPGHKADFAVVVMDPSPLAVDDVHQRLLAGPLGPALVPTYSFVSLTEVSEYVPTVEQYAARLVAEGEVADSPSYNAKVQGYAAREPAMRQARLEPELPPWPNACFYPMNKKRKVGENWFTLPFAERSRLMAEHGASGMKFGGRVTQLITVAVGLDDWEWGVTLWARRPATPSSARFTPATWRRRGRSSPTATSADARRHSRMADRTTSTSVSLGGTRPSKASKSSSSFDCELASGRSSIAVGKLDTQIRSPPSA